MKKIAPEVERLMWLIAEERDPRAIADFESRFPDLKLELSKHMAMVSGLKTAGKKAPAPRIPRFVPRYAAPPKKQTGLYVAIAFVAGALAFGSYAGFTLLSPQTPKPVTHMVAPPKIEKPPVSEPDPVQIRPELHTTPPPETHETEPRTSDFVDPLTHPVSFDVGSAPLKVVVAMICKSAGVQAEVPLDLPETDASLHCDAVPAGELLTNLGKAYGFTVFPQETGKILIIPGRPSSDPDSAETSMGRTKKRPTTSDDREHPSDPAGDGTGREEGVGESGMIRPR